MEKNNKDENENIDSGLAEELQMILEKYRVRSHLMFIASEKDGVFESDRSTPLKNLFLYRESITIRINKIMRDSGAYKDL